MRKIYTILAAAIAFLAATAAAGQSKSFKLGQWTEIHSAIVKELNRSYVDSLPVDRIMRAGVDAMLEELDPYTVYIPEEENEDLQMMLSNTYGGIGAIIHKTTDSNVIINEPYANSPASKAGLTCGDEIISIDGTLTKGLKIKESTDRMKGKPGTTVVFKVKKVRTGDTLDVPVLRERIHLPDVQYAEMLDNTTGYLLLGGFTENVGADVRAEFIKLKNKGMKRFVLDLRGNGGGLMGEAVNIISIFVPKGTLAVSSKGNTESSLKEFHTTLDPVDTEMPLIVLVDSGSASASEIVAGAIQDHKRGIIMGTRSYGKGLVQSIRLLPYNGQMKVTTAKYYTPSERCVQAIDYKNRNEDGTAVKHEGGIAPDVTIEAKEYSRLVYALVLGGVIDQYAIDYARRHESIPAVEEFRFSNEDYEDFIAFAKTQEFDYRSSAKTLYDQMKEELKKDGLAETMSEELKVLDSALEMDKERFLRLKMDEIIPFIEEELVTRYWFQKAGVEIRLRYDDQLKEALSA